MKLTDIVNKLGLTVYGGADGLERDVTGGYSSDLLSDVMGRAAMGSVWVTVQTHRNVIAVASLRDLPAVIIAGGVTPGDETVEQSNADGVPLLGSSQPAFDVTGRLYALLKG